MPFNRSELRVHDRTWLVKFVLRTVIFVAAVVAVGCFAWIVATLHDDYIRSFTITFEYFVFIPLGISIIWYIASTIVLFLKSKPVHPGWHVGFDLILWLGYLIFDIFIGYSAISDYSYGVTNYYGDYGYNSGPGYGVSDGSQDDGNEQALVNQAETAAKVELAGWVMLLVLLLLHFTLFVWACVDTERYRRNHTARHMAEEMIEVMRSNGQLPPAQQPLLHPAGPEMSRYQDASEMPTTPYMHETQYMAGGLATHTGPGQAV